MKIGIDLDNTITASKQSIEFFSVLTNLLIAENKIYIITNRKPNTHQDVANELDCLNIDYNEIIITDEKIKFIKENNIEIFFDDMDENFLELGEEVQVFKVREPGGFDFSAKKWIGNNKTVRMI